MRFLLPVVLVALAACSARPPEPGVTPSDGPSETDPVGDDFSVVLPPFHQAALDGDAEAIEQHLAEGADLDAFAQIAPPPDAVVTPLHCAAAAGHAAIVRRLIEAGADVEARSSFFGSPLTLASTGDATPEVIRILLSAGADPNVPNGELQTPLHRAVGDGAVDLAALLLGAGADPTLEDDQGQTPLDIAREWDDDDLIALLTREAGDE
ncbi:MAG: ankyrin repeat domain-containing protein [Bacteroidota bacterium]